MKKTLAVLAVLAVAAVAQAELLATWNFANDGSSSLTPNENAANHGQVTFSNLTRVNGLTSASTQTSSFTANNWGDGTATATTAPAIEFTLNVASGFEVAQSVIAVDSINGNNSGPNKVQWALDGTDVGSAWASTSASQGSTAYPQNTGDGFTVAAGNHTFHLYSNTTQGNNGNAVGSTAGRVNLKTSMTFDGKIQAATAVPEPATMSLLGLGALAMALRRKLRK